MEFPLLWRQALRPPSVKQSCVLNEENIDFSNQTWLHICFLPPPLDFLHGAPLVQTSFGHENVLVHVQTSFGHVDVLEHIQTSFGHVDV